MDRGDWQESREASERAVEAARTALEEAPCSLRELARQIDRSPAALSRYRSGERGMRLFHARQILKAVEAVRARYESDAERCADLAEPIRSALQDYEETAGENPLLENREDSDE